MSTPRTWLLTLVVFTAFLALIGFATFGQEDEWTTVEPEVVGLDGGRLETMREVIEGLDLPVDSIVILRHGKLVFEHHADPLRKGPNKIHNLYSTTKSVTSLLIGIAIDKGYIESVDQRVIDFFPDRDIANVDDRKRRMTIEHLLTMTSGLEWEGPDDMYHSWGEAIMSGDPVQYTLDQPMAHEPGEAWYYNGGGSHLLSAILTEATGTTTYRFAREHLFGPLGITRVRWPRDPNGIYYGGQDIWLTPYGMAKLGQLFLNGGIWKGERIVSSEWVADSTRTLAPSWWGGYGYQWWTFPEAGIYFAAGAFEQRIYASPDLDMIVVVTSSNMAEGTRESAGERSEGPPVVEWLLGRFILPAADGYTGAEYEAFGFAVEKPLIATPRTVYTSGDNPAAAISGRILFDYGGCPLEETGVQWEPTDAPYAFEAALEGFLGVAETSGLRFGECGPLQAAVLGGRVLVYQRSDLIVEDRTLRGVVGVTFSAPDERAYLLYYTAEERLSEWIDPIAGFKDFFRGFEPSG